LFQDNDVTDVSSQTQMTSRTLTSSCKNSAQRKQGNTEITTTRIFVDFVYQITIPRNQSRKVTGSTAKYAKFDIMNCVLVLSGKRPLPVENVFDRNCTSL
jgi:hypothetical protein